MTLIISQHTAIYKYLLLIFFPPRIYVRISYIFGYFFFPISFVCLEPSLKPLLLVWFIVYPFQQDFCTISFSYLIVGSFNLPWILILVHKGCSTGVCVRGCRNFLKAGSNVNVQSMTKGKPFHIHPLELSINSNLRSLIS